MRFRDFLLFVFVLTLLVLGPSWVFGQPPVEPAAVEALADVNARRAARGLPPFAEDPGLTEAAKRAAAFRARHRLFGHVPGTPGDFGFLPPGVSADSAGCAAYDDHTVRRFGGWLSCCMDENWRFAGAAWARGTDGKRYMHLFVRNSPPARAVPPPAPPVAPMPPPAPPVADDPPLHPDTAGPALAATCAVSRGNAGGSGTCVGCENGVSVVVTNNHIFTDVRTAGGWFAMAPYPLACVVTPRGGKELKATAVGGCELSDIAVVLVEGEIPVAPIAEQLPKVGDRVWHAGMGRRGLVRRGKAMRSDFRYDHPSCWFSADCESVSGDSGSGVFNDRGELVAVLCGTHGVGQPGQPPPPLRGTLVGSAVLVLEIHTGPRFPRLRAALGRFLARHRPPGRQPAPPPAPPTQPPPKAPPVAPPPAPVAPPAKTAPAYYWVPGGPAWSNCPPAG